MATPLDPKQIVSSGELLMSQVVQQEPSPGCLWKRGYSPRRSFGDGRGGGSGDEDKK